MPTAPPSPRPPPSLTDLVVSPYHLATGDPAAFAALLLARRVVTVLPTPFNFQGGEPGRAQVRVAVDRAPRYLRLLDSWRWSGPLWTAGVLASTDEGDDPADAVRSARDRIAQEQALGPLRAFLRPGIFDEQDVYLDEVSADLLRGGADPGIGIPFAAGIDAFAHQHAFTPVRSAAVSVTQRAEASLGRRVIAFAVPVLTRASGQHILAARVALAQPLDALRRAIDLAVTAPDPAPPAPRAELDRAVREYTRAFAERFGPARSSARDDDTGARVEDATVSVTVMELPADAVFASSLQAARALGVASPRTPSPRTPSPRTPSPRTPAPSASSGPAARSPTIRTLIIKRMTIEPAATTRDAGEPS